jgi:hypothetical protein
MSSSLARDPVASTTATALEVRRCRYARSHAPLLVVSTCTHVDDMILPVRVRCVSHVKRLLIIRGLSRAIRICSRQSSNFTVPSRNEKGSVRRIHASKADTNHPATTAWKCTCCRDGRPRLANVRDEPRRASHDSSSGRRDARAARRGVGSIARLGRGRSPGPTDRVAGQNHRSSAALSDQRTLRRSTGS